MRDLRRYDRFGWDYGHWNVTEEREVRWYRRHARATGGPVLELACGTGPLLPTLAGDGHQVTALDLSDTMLDLARRRIAGLPAEVGARIRLVKGDMAHFRLGETFALVLIADNSFREVETRRGMHACLACIRKHLRPDGRLLVTERRFDPSRFVDGVCTVPWSAPFEHPETGDRIERRVVLRFDEETRMVYGVMTYRLRAPGGRTTEEELPFAGPAFDPKDYAALFEEAGFTSRLFVGYEERGDDGVDPNLCFVCHPRRGA